MDHISNVCYLLILLLLLLVFLNHFAVLFLEIQRLRLILLKVALESVVFPSLQACSHMTYVHVPGPI